MFDGPNGRLVCHQGIITTNFNTVVGYYKVRYDNNNTEEYDEEGITMYEVRLKKKKHELILLIDEDGYVIETIKERYLN